MQCEPLVGLRARVPVSRGIHRPSRIQVVPDQQIAADRRRRSQDQNRLMPQNQRRNRARPPPRKRREHRELDHDDEAGIERQRREIPPVERHRKHLALEIVILLSAISARFVDDDRPRSIQGPVVQRGQSRHHTHVAAAAVKHGRQNHDHDRRSSQQREIFHAKHHLGEHDPFAIAAAGSPPAVLRYKSGRVRHRCGARKNREYCGARRCGLAF